MKKLINTTLALGFVLALAGAGFARPSGEVKASPLYQQSLQQSIARLEGKAGQTQQQQIAGANLPTGQNMCPMLPYTQSQTCSPTYCGSETCGSTCGGSYTCWATCASTCGTNNTCQNTCGYTCLGGVCFNFSGHAYWRYGSNSGSDWNNDGPGSLGGSFGMEPAEIYAQPLYGDGVYGQQIEINYSNSYYDGTDVRSTMYSGTYRVGCQGYVEYINNPGDWYSAEGWSDQFTLQAHNSADFSILIY